MIYHNYSPYYYGRPTNSNKKITNNNNSYISTLYNTTNSNKYSTVAYNNNSYYNFEHKNAKRNSKNNYYNSNFTLEQTHKENTNEWLEQKKIPPKSNNDVVFEIFGIKLYFDDILLICLIFFLYSEGVQDQYLFIALILLLLC